MPPPSGLILEVSINCDSWISALPDYEKYCNLCVEQITQHILEARSLCNLPHVELSIVLCDDALIRELNHDYRSKDKPTNVLSFQGLDDQEIDLYLRNSQVVPDHPLSLGEIFIAYETMRSEADKSVVKLSEHFQHIVIHGVLHVLGYDHIDDEEAKIMEAIETRLLKKLGIDDPYNA